MSRANHRRLFIIGLGVKGLKQLTREAEAALKKSELIFHVGLLPATVAALRKINPRLRRTDKLIVSASDANASYKIIADTVLNQARKLRTTGFVTYGNPMFFVTPARHLVHDAPSAGIRVSIVPGVSSMDNMLCQPDFPINENGLQLIVAETLVAYGLKLNPSFSALLFQLRSFGSKKRGLLRRQPKSSYVVLRDYLMRFYPERHPVTLMTCAFDGSFHQTAQLATFPLCKLADKSPLFLPPSSLYIPQAVIPRLTNKFLSP